MAFFRSKAFLWWVGLNAALPIVVNLILRAGQFSLGINNFIAYSTVAAILGGNIFALMKFKAARPWFYTIIALNLFALVVLSDISFVTLIPDLPFVFRSIFQLFTQ